MGGGEGALVKGPGYLSSHPQALDDLGKDLERFSRFSFPMCPVCNCGRKAARTGGVWAGKGFGHLSQSHPRP